MKKAFILYYETTGIVFVWIKFGHIMVYYSLLYCIRSFSALLTIVNWCHVKSKTGISCVPIYS